MSFNGSGTFNRLYSWVVQAGLGQKIRSDFMDTDTNDIATGLSNCICKDGQTTIAANIPMNSKKFTGLASGSASGDSATYGQLNTVAPQYVATVAGTANAITLTPSFALTAYAAGISYEFLPASTNTSGTVTVAVSALATRNIKKSIGGAVVILAVGDLVASVPAHVIDDGTQYILLNPQVHAQGADVASASTVVLDGVTGEYVNITGTTTMTAITLAQGREVTVQFSGALTLTNGANLILPGGANITTAAGDCAVFRGEASGVVRCTAYQKATGNSVIQTTTTQSAKDNSTKIASTAYADNAASTIPQNSQSTAYTTVLADAGKAIYHPAADVTARTFTIDSNANVAYPVGTTITFVNEHGAGVLTIAITTDTMRLASAGTTGNRTLTADGIATAYKMTSTSWLISGVGLT